MAARTLFISTDIFKELFTYDVNIDDKVIVASTYSAQTNYIKRVLGTQLYNRVVNEINTSVTPEIKTLLEDYIEQPLIHYTNAELYKYLTFRISNKGVVTTNTDNANVPNADVIETLRQEEISLGNKHSEILYRYLLANTTLYPEFTQSSSIADILPQLNYDKIGYGYNSNTNINDSENGYHKCNDL